MHVLILGGTRYFGRAAARQLLESGHRVTIFSRGRVRPPFWKDIEFVQGDRQDADGLVQQLAGRSFDGVIDNLCFNRQEAEGVIRALQGQVGRYVVASTVSVYGEGGHARVRHTVRESLTEEERFAVDYRYREPVRESDLDNANQPWEYRPHLSPYGEGKRQMESVMLESPADWPFIIVRVPATLGPGDPSGRFPWWLSRIMDGDPVLVPDGGTLAVQVGYSNDLATFLIKLFTHGGTRTVYNYAQPEMPALINWLQAVAEAARRPLHPVSVPAEMLQRYTDLPWQDWSYAPFTYCPLLMSTSKAEAEVGLDFRVSLRDWVQTTVDAYLQEPAGLEHATDAGLRAQEVQFARKWADLKVRLGELLR